jgi:hypothetical protein
MTEMYYLNLWSKNQVILVSSDKSFVFNEMISISGLRDDKFQAHEVDLTQAELIADYINKNKVLSE